MNVGLLSYHKNYNYGWNLQCFALMSILKSLGHDVTYIDKRKFERPQSVNDIVKSKIRFLFEKLHLLPKVSTYEEWQHIKGANTESFFCSRIVPRTFPVYSAKELLDLPKYDAIVVGSDQCWRAKLVYPITNYYLDFVKYPCKKISYAASFGSGDVEYSEIEIEKCGNLIKLFDAVSVRESEGVSLIKDKYNWDCNPVQMPDPTLLLDPSEYRRLIPDTCITEKPKGIFSYILDNTGDKCICLNSIKLCYQKDVYSVDLNTGVNNPVPSVEEWLSHFVNADFVFTDSFHGVVFSIIFRKPFIVYANKERGLSRFLTILDMFELQDRLIYSSDDLKTTFLSNMRDIDIEKINRYHRIIKNKGINFLNTNL